MGGLNGHFDLQNEDFLAIANIDNGHDQVMYQYRLITDFESPVGT